MASKSIKGITIEIGGDTTKLGQALSGVNSQSKSLQNELRDVEKLLKLDPTNTELLAQKQKILAESVDNTKDKLNTLKEAQEQIKRQFENGEIDEGQYRAFQRELIKTEAELKDLENDSQGAEKQVDKLGDTSEKTSKKMDMLKGVASGVVTACKTIAAVGVGTATAIGGMAVSAGKSADDLNTLSKQTGISTSDLQKFQYATDLIDVSMDTLTGSLAKCTKNMSSAQGGTGATAEAFAKLGVSVTDANGNLRNNQDVFNESIDALGKISNETERDALAMQIFGKSAQDLNPLILGGADALKELGQQAEDMGLIMDQDTLDSANAFNDELDKMKATGTSAFKVVGSAVAKDFMPMMEEGNQLVTDITKNLIDGYKDGGLDGLVGAIGDSLSMIVTKISEYAPQIIDLAINLIQSLLQGLQDSLPIITQCAVDIVSTLITGILDMLPQILQMGIDLIVNLAQGIANALPTLIPKVVDTIVLLVDTFLDNIDQIIDTGIQLIMALADGLIEALPRLIDKVPVIIEKLINALVNNAPKLVAGSIELVVQLATGIIKNLPLLLSKIPEIVGSILSGLLSSITGGIGDVGRQLVEGLWNGIDDAADWVIEKIKGFGSDILDGIKSFFGIHSPSTLFRDEVGKYLAEGMAVGISDNADKPINATDDIFNDIADQVDGINLDKAINRTFNSDVNLSATGGINTSTPSVAQPITIIVKAKDLVLGKAVINDLKELTKINGSNPVLEF